MSELLKVASALRRMTDEQLVSLANQRMVSTRSLVDFFDFAEVLTKPASIASALAGLPRSFVVGLRDLAAKQKVSNKISEQLAAIGLVDVAPKFEPFESTLESLSAFAKPAVVTAVIDQVPDAVSQENIDRDAGVEIFQTLQAINELIFDLEQRYVREVGRGNVGLPDLKRLATHLRKSNDYAREIYELAHLAKLIVLNEGRWQLSANAEIWLTWPQAKQLELLASTWQQILGDTSSKELLDSLKQAPGPASMRQKLMLTYPLADVTISSKISKLASLAQAIGISASGFTSSWAKAILQSDFKRAVKLAETHLPQVQRRIICQADLTLVAPGPLPTDVEITLRRFAATEQIGMASTYRLSALSLSHGLETGMTIAEIRSLLIELSGRDLPQPIEYLLKEAEVRFGRLTISVNAGENGEIRSVIKSTDRILLTEIINELKLKPFSLRQASDGSITSRFEPEVLYFGLREIGFVVVRIDQMGKVISPMVSIGNSAGELAEASTMADIKRIREHEAKIGEAPDDDDLQRQIQLAIKNKARARFTVTSRSGEIEFLLEPIAIANGRLRAKDRKADIERTLPLTSIVRVVID
ncbi:MAG: helicase-associated domain-containing protein [Rhodoluna sp.]